MKQILLLVVFLAGCAAPHRSAPPPPPMPDYATIVNPTITMGSTPNKTRAPCAGAAVGTNCMPITGSLEGGSVRGRSNERQNQETIN